MNSRKYKDLSEKYINGQTSLEEEKELYLASNLENEELNTWVKYVNLQKRNAPQNLNQTLWEQSSLRKKNHTPIIAGLISIAACIALIISLPSIINQKDSNYEAKKLLLEEAMAMIESSESNTESKEIFYKDNLVTIYLSYD